MKSPDGQSGLWGLTLGSGYLRRLPVWVLPAADSLLALGALAVHRSGLEAALFEPLLDQVFGEADIRLDP